jgi:hypothetical protein
MANQAPPPDHQTTEPRSQNVVSNGCQAETVVGLPWAADNCPWVGKLRTVLPLSGVIRDSAVQLVLTHQRCAGAGTGMRTTRTATAAGTMAASQVRVCPQTTCASSLAERTETLARCIATPADRAGQGRWLYDGRAT